MSDLPAQMWFGTVKGQWPIYCWESKSHAIAFLRDEKVKGDRKVWQAKIADPVEFEAVAPEPFMRPKAATS